jgi:hypothetical protein
MAGKRAEWHRRQLAALLDRDGAECVWCRRELTPLDPDATLDHVVTRGRQGPNGALNTVAKLVRYERLVRSPVPATTHAA